jgi:hypothetical protein
MTGKTLVRENGFDVEVKINLPGRLLIGKPNSLRNFIMTANEKREAM